MTDYILPPWLKIARTRFSYIDNTGISRSEFTGAIVTGSRGGDRLGASLEFSPAGGASINGQMERAAIKAFLTRLRGRQNRAYLYDPGYRCRGALSSWAELLPNNTFGGGTTGWGSGSIFTREVYDRVMVIRVTGGISGISTLLVHTSLVNVTQYVPHLCRIFFNPLVPGLRAASSVGIYHTDSASAGTLGNIYFSVTGLLPEGMQHFAHVPYASSESVRFHCSPLVHGNEFFVPYVSFARCMLVDNGQNLFTWSDDQSHSDWQAEGLIDRTAGYYVAPDNTMSGTRLRSNLSTSVHGINQSRAKPATAQDWCFAGAFRRGDDPNGNYRYVRLSIDGGSSANSCWATFDLETGTLTTRGSNGTFSNARAYVHALDSTGWYYCAVVGRTGSETTIRGRVLGSDNDSSFTIPGDGTSNFGTWRLTLAQSAVPVRLTQTTSSTTTGSNQTGSMLRVKGGRSPTEGALSGALLPGDQFAVYTSRGWELKIVTAPCALNAAGLGVLQFEPPLRGVPADEAPIVIVQPFGRFIFSGEMVGWDEEPGVIIRASADFEEAA